jgi:hypothetical protein
MSALWSAEVIAKDTQRVTVEVRAIHPDSGEFSDSKKFSLRLIYDETFRYGPGSVREICGPLGEAVQPEQIFDEAFLDGNVDRFIEHVTLRNVRNAPLDVEALHDKIERELSARKVRRDDRAAWRAAWDERWDAFWRDPAQLPTATYEIDVTDPRWIAHLGLGSHWESAAY